MGHDQDGLSAQDQAVSDALAKTAHELRTQLSGVLGMLHLVLDTRLSPEQTEYLHLARSSGDAMLTLLNDLLDRARLHAGRLDLEEIPFSLADSVSETVSVYEGSAREKRLLLETKIDSSLPRFLVGDPGRLRQVLSNLVSNAIKFTEEGSVSVSVEVVDKSPESARIRFVVSDTGIGFDPREEDGLFDAFTQSDQTPARVYGGTGLGLSISLELVNAMGGTMEVASEPGRGSQFSFVLEFPVADAAVQTVVRLQHHSWDDLPVLVIAERERSRASLSAIIKDLGMPCTATADFEDGQSQLKEAARADRPYALVVVDMGTESIDLAEILRGDDALSSMHVMVVTASGRRGDAARCRELRIASYLSTPLSATEISDAIAAVLVGPAPSDLTVLVTRHWLRERRDHLDVLVVDDSPTNRMVATRLLENRGHSVYTVVNGRDAVEAVGTFRFDVIIMDIAMPEMGGIEATKLIRNHEVVSGERVPILGTTGSHSIEEVITSCLEAGMDALIPKPFDAIDLTESLEQILVAT